MSSSHGAGSGKKSRARSALPQRRRVRGGNTLNYNQIPMT